MQHVIPQSLAHRLYRLIVALFSAPTVHVLAYLTACVYVLFPEASLGML